MAQHDYVIDNQSFPATRTDINNVLLAISSTNSGATAPSTTYASQLWYDTSENKLYIRNEDNDAWIPLFLLDQSNDVAGTLATQIDVEDASGTDTAGTALTIKGGAGTGTGAGGSIIFQTADGAGSTGSSVNAHATQVTITDDGNVGIGTSSPSQIGSRTTMEISSADGAGIRLSDGSNNMLVDYNDTVGGRVRVSASENLAFGTTSLDRMIITSGGSIYQSTGNAYHGREGSGGSFASGERSHLIYAGSTSHYLQLSGRNVADASPSFLVVVDGTTRAEIEANGDYQSATNSYGSTSDETLKENIVASGSQWDDIKAVQVKKFSYIEDDLDAPNLLGVIAQDLEASGMSGLVKTKTKTSQTEDGDEEVVLDDDGNPVTYKTVKYSILYMKAVKALQEAMERIETLETRLTALEG